MNKIKPDSKQYKRTPLNDNPFTTFKLPDEVQKDFNEYLKAFPNRNKGMLEIIIDVLNSKCTERKYYDIDVVSIFSDIVDDDEKSCKGLYLSSKDNYLIGREGLSINSSSIILNDETYLNPSKELSLKDFYDMLQNNHFTYSFSNSATFNYDDYSLVYFKINNFLDEFIDNEYKTANGNHKGIGYYFVDYNHFVDYDPWFYVYDPLFYVYDWKFNDNADFELLDIRLISEKEFNALILNSSNAELKQFLKGFKPYEIKKQYLKSIYPIFYREPISDVPIDSKIDELKKEIMELKKQYGILEEQNKTLQEENYSLKLKNTKLLEVAGNKSVEELTEQIKEILKDMKM